jgi:hypothetical protein
LKEEKENLGEEKFGDFDIQGLDLFPENTLF